jgi:inward rectifier potassium channel
MNPDGSFNIERVDHHRGAKKRDYYHRLLTMRWKAFMAYLIGVYLGTVVPHGALANLVVTINALSGLLYIALLTGVFFARFSRPTAKVIFSDKAIIQTIDGIPCLMLRFANLRANQIIEAQVTMTYARNEVTAEGERFRNFGTLNLETNRSSMFVLSWTVVHPIDPSSPLYGLSQKDLLANEAEIFVVMTGWDETFAQTIHARRSYGPDEIFWNYRYEDMAERTPDNRCLILDIRKINNVAPV